MRKEYSRATTNRLYILIGLERMDVEFAVALAKHPESTSELWQGEFLEDA